MEDLARLSIRPSAVYTGVHDDSAAATVDGLQQGYMCAYIHVVRPIFFFTIMLIGLYVGYVLCPAEQRFMLLYTFLKKNIGKKVMVSTLRVCMYVCMSEYGYLYIYSTRTVLYGRLGYGSGDTVVLVMLDGLFHLLLYVLLGSFT